MILEEIAEAWKAEDSHLQASIDADRLANELRISHDRFLSTVLWRDILEASAGLLLIPVWIVMGIVLSLPWTWYLMVPVSLWNAGFLWQDRKRHPQQPSAPGRPLASYAQDSLKQVEHQIWLLRNVQWWYLLPFATALSAFFLHVAWEVTTSWLGCLLFAGILMLFTAAVCAGTYRINRRTIAKQLIPRRDGLQKAIDALARDEESGDVMDLIAQVTRPELSEDGFASWAANWDRIVPTWFEAGIVVAATVGGAALGLYSGLVLEYRHLGPTFFQAVVCAVIPFELALGWYCLRAYRSKDKIRKASHPGPVATHPATGPSSPAPFPSQGSEEQPRRLPSAPALVIISLTILISLLALLAIAAFFHYEDDLSLRAPQQPAFGDVSSLSDHDRELLDSWLFSQYERARYPSLSVAIVRDQSIVYSRSLGFADIESGQEASTQTPYNTASVTKVFTASLAAILAEQGHINLDDPVISVLPANTTISTTPALGAEITFRQLASHTSGLPRGVPGSVQTVDDWYAMEPERLYQLLAQVELDSAPGTKEHYSNLAFGLLGHALERATDKSLDQLFASELSKPLGLRHTMVPTSAGAYFATGYDDSGYAVERTHSLRNRLAGSGGLVSTVEDLAAFLMSQMEPNSASNPFTQSMLDELHARTRLTNEARSMTGTALGWSIGWKHSIGRYLQKNGGRSNCSAWIGFSPEYKVGVVVITNSGGPSVDPIGRWLLERCVPGAYQPATKHGYAYVAPYSAVTWSNARPVVQVAGEWFPLESVDGIGVDELVQFAEQNYGDAAQKRIAEDLVRVLAEMGHPPDWRVTLGLRHEDGKIEERLVEMTTDNRYRVRKNLLEIGN